MRKNLRDVRAAIATNINESAESTITRVLFIDKDKYAVMILMILKTFIIFLPYILFFIFDINFDQFFQCYLGYILSIYFIGVFYIF